MRDLNAVILHCTATTKDRELTVKEIRKWHKARGWRDIGYHFVIMQDGTVERGRHIKHIGAHTLNINAQSVGVAYCGGVDAEGNAKDTMTVKQAKAFRELYKGLVTIFGELELKGHNDFNQKKECPSFKVKEKFHDLINT